MVTPLPAFNAMTASARIQPPKRRLTPTYQSWQDELWKYYDSLGEFESGIGWKANTISRIRLTVAEVSPGGDEPTLVETGLAAEAIERLAGGTGGQTQLMKEMARHLGVPGECWLLGEVGDRQGLFTGEETWSVKSADELRVASRRVDGVSTYEVREDETQTSWRLVNPDSLVVRVWDPHPRYGWQANSSARHARTALVKLDLINKRIIATIISRLASNGLLMYDKNRLSFQPRVNPAGTDEVDPFAEMLVEVASRGIEDPTSPEAVIPIPIGFSIEGDLANVRPDMLIRHLTFASKVDEQLLGQRQDALRELAISLDLPVDVLLGMTGMNHWCVDDQTEILTQFGWRRESQLKPGDEVLTLNHDSGMSEWQPVLDIYRANVVDEQMLLLETRNHSSLTTLSHRWPTLRRRSRDGILADERGITLTRELTAAHRLVTAVPHEDLPTISKHDDALVELIAWTWTDSSVSRDGRSLMLFQSHSRNPERVARIRRCLTKLFGKVSQSLHGTSSHGPAWRERIQSNETGFGGPITNFYLNLDASAILLEYAPRKRVRFDFIRDLTAAQLELFIDVSCQGDGQHYRRGGLDIWQHDSRLLDAYELALILSGRAVRRSVDGHYVNAHRASVICPIKAIEHAERRGDERTRREFVNYSGRIWCPVTSNGTWLARRSATTAYFTGNSAWQVEESGLKIHIAPTAELITHSLTVGYLVPYLRAAGADFRGPSGGRLIVWYDPSELAVRPDKSQSVMAAYDRFEASGDALRREAGLNQDDAPDAADLREMILKTQVKMPQLSTTAFLELTGSEENVSNTLIPNGDADQAGDDDEDEESTEGGTPDTDDDEPPGVTAPVTPPGTASALTVDDLSDEELTRMYELVSSGFESGRLVVGNGHATPWVEAGTPLDEAQRVTPRRRSAKKAVAAEEV